MSYRPRFGAVRKGVNSPQTKNSPGTRVCGFKGTFNQLFNQCICFNVISMRVRFLC